MGNDLFEPDATGMTTYLTCSSKKPTRRVALLAVLLLMEGIEFAITSSKNAEGIPAFFHLRVNMSDLCAVEGHLMHLGLDQNEIEPAVLSSIFGFLEGESEA